MRGITSHTLALVSTRSLFSPFPPHVAAATQVKNNEEYSEILKYMGDMSLMLSMTQSLLYLKSPHIDDREKEVLKRELGDEMVSCCCCYCCIP